MKIDCKIEIEIGEFKILMTLEEVVVLRDRLNEICPSNRLQYQQGIRHTTYAVGPNSGSLTRDAWPKRANDPDITLRQGE